MTAIIMSPFPPLLIHLLSVLSIFNLSTMIESTASLLTRTCKLLGWVSAYTHALHCVRNHSRKGRKETRQGSPVDNRPSPCPLQPPCKTHILT